MENFQGQLIPWPNDAVNCVCSSYYSQSFSCFFHWQEMIHYLQDYIDSPKKNILMTGRGTFFALKSELKMLQNPSLYTPSYPWQDEHREFMLALWICGGPQPPFQPMATCFKNHAGLLFLKLVCIFVYTQLFFKLSVYALFPHLYM